MMRWIVGAGAGVLLTVAGLIIIRKRRIGHAARWCGNAVAGPEVAMQSGLGSPSHVFGAALIVIGLLTSAAVGSRAQPRVRSFSLAVTDVAHGLANSGVGGWTTPAAVPAIVAVACGSVFT
jgi:hypothetical protein